MEENQIKKIAICGSPDFAKPFFEEFLKSKNYKIEFAITQTSKAQNRGKNIKQTSISLFANKHNIQCFEVESTKNKNDELIEKLKEIDCVILFAFGKIIPNTWLNLPKFGWLNIHPSKLPILRGPSPIQYTILQQHKKSAITLMKMDEKMDEGNIIAQKEFIINENHSKNIIMQELTIFGPKWILEQTTNFLNGKIFAKKQIGKSTYSQLIKKADYIITNETPIEIICKIRAFGFVYLDFNKEIIKCYLAKIANENSLINIQGIEPIFLQKQGKKTIHIKQFMNGLKSNKNNKI